MSALTLINESLCRYWGAREEGLVGQYFGADESAGRSTNRRKPWKRPALHVFEASSAGGGDNKKEDSSLCVGSSKGHPHCS